MSDLGDLQRRALETRATYDILNRNYDRPVWVGKGYTMSFAGGAGNLIKSKENMRHVDEVDEKLAHGLSDRLWPTFVITDFYSVDLETAFLKTTDKLQLRLKEQKR